MKTMRIASIAAAIITLFLNITAVHAGIEAPQEWTPDLNLIAQVEKKLGRPQHSEQGQGFKPLAQYDRYYAGVMMENRRVLKAIYLLENNKDNGTIKIVDFKSLPLVMDGGCSVIDLEYDVDNDKVLKYQCHGFA